jgi:hypothetical protein
MFFDTASCQCINKPVCDSAIECPAGELLDDTTCACAALHPTEGTLFDLRDTPDLRLIRVHFNEKFTVREWSVSGQWEWTNPWSNPSTEQVQCVTEIETYEDPQKRYRQATLHATTAECRWFFSRFKVDASMTTTGTAVEGTATAESQQWQFVVWPDRPLESMGTVIDIDSDVREVQVQGDEYFTAISHEWATPTGFAWNPPEHTYTCVDLIDINHGQFSTGYQQWVYKAKNADCEETVPVTRSEHWTEPGVVEDFVIKVTYTDTPVCAPFDCPEGEQFVAAECSCVAVQQC